MARPVPFEILLETTLEVVYGALCTIFAPASWCWPLPAKAIESTSPRAPGSISHTAGYFIVSLLPRLPSPTP